MGSNAQSLIHAGMPFPSSRNPAAKLMARGPRHHQGIVSCQREQGCWMLMVRLGAHAVDTYQLLGLRLGTDTERPEQGPGRVAGA